MYKQYSVVYKHFMGRHERLLTIDGDYIHLVLSASKKILDISGKTVKKNKEKKTFFWIGELSY